MKIEKILKKCSVCEGKKTMPVWLAAQLPKPPKPGETLKCTHCKGKGFVFVKV